jgi:23S rRNA (uracil1939-C5)-methyltransferase
MAKRGDSFAVTIESLDEKGQGVGQLGEYAVYVRGALPGDQVQVVARRVRNRQRRIDARSESLIKSNIDRIAPVCTHFGLCGGCSWQDVPYKNQVAMKQLLLDRCLDSVGINIAQDEPLVVEEPFYYRNKMEFSFGTSPDLDVELGLHIPGRFDRVFDLEACHLQSEHSNAIVAFVRKFVQERRLSVYHLKRHEGLLRFLTVREGKNTDEIMVILTTSGEPCSDIEDLANALCAEFPNIKSVVHAINRRKAQVAFGDEEIVAAGRGAIQERLGEFIFEISPQSFFQTNTLQAEKLYRRVVELADLTAHERVLDVYCGTGSISTFLAQRAKSVLGIEVSDAAVADAVRNTAANNHDNCQFMAGHAEVILKQLVAQGDRFEVAVTDPPRSGMHPKARDALVALRPARIVYVSCNPKVLAEDLNFFGEAGYQTDYIQLVDMFPHTPHCEILARVIDTK